VIVDLFEGEKRLYDGVYTRGTRLTGRENLEGKIDASAGQDKRAKTSARLTSAQPARFVIPSARGLCPRKLLVHKTEQLKKIGQSNGHDGSAHSETINPDTVNDP
jgi:hypothetical protein